MHSKPCAFAVRFWFDNVTDFITLLGEIQTKLETSLDARQIDESYQDVVAIAIVFFLVVMIISAFPIIAWSTQRVTRNIHVFAVNLMAKTEEIKMEKHRTDSLLHQMLPEEIVNQLKEKKTTTAEYFDCVTIFFSEVVNFTEFCLLYSPMQVVELLNMLYCLFDNVSTHYDVYKVETVNDSYMVASGK